MTCLLADIQVTPTGAALIGAVALAALALGFLLFRKDTEIEQRRKAAIEAAEVLTAQGLTLLPAILTDYAVGDYSGMINRIRSAARMLLNPKHAEAEFDQLFTNMLERRLKDPETRATLVEKVNKLAELHGSSSASSKG